MPSDRYNTISKNIINIDHLVDQYTGEILGSNSDLGTTAKSLGNSSITSARSSRYTLQRLARKLMPNERVATCQRVCGSAGVAINVSPSAGLASFGGVVTCGSVWVCPVCSAKISNARRKELNLMLEWARAAGYQATLVTLTARHGIDDPLPGLLASMKLAKTKLHQARGWTDIKSHIIGHVTATEVTYGDSGWHVHFHMLVVMDCGFEQQALAMLDGLGETWLKVLSHKDVNLSGNGHAFDVQGAMAAGDYITKWGAGEQVVVSNPKAAKEAKKAASWGAAEELTLDQGKQGGG